MVEQVLDEMKQYFLTYNKQAFYLLLSEDNHSKLSNEYRPIQEQTFLGMKTEPILTTFSGLQIILVKGQNRMELA